MRKKLIILFIVGIVAVVAVFISSYSKPSTGSVILNFSWLPAGRSITLNDKVVQPESKTSTSLKYQLESGPYNLSITAPGYKPFKTSFTLKKDEEIQVAAQVEFEIDPTITSADRVTELKGSGLSITDVRYYYGKTWSTFQLQVPNTDPAFAAAQYDPVQGIWSIKAGPGTYFSSDDITDLPSQVSSYLIDL